MCRVCARQRSTADCSYANGMCLLVRSSLLALVRRVYTSTAFSSASCSLSLLGLSNRNSLWCFLRIYRFSYSTPAVGQRVGQADLHRRPRSLAVCHARARHGSRGRRHGVFGRLAAPRADPRRRSEETRTRSIHGASEFRISQRVISVLYPGMSLFDRACKVHSPCHRFSLGNSDWLFKPRF